MRGLAAAIVFVACGSRSGLYGEGQASAEAPPSGGPLAAVPAPALPSLPEDELPSLPEDELPVPPPLLIETRVGCVDITRSYTSVPATVMLLIDQSGSMTQPFGGSTRWNVLRDAIVDREDGLLTWLDTSASIGLMLYSSIGGFAGGQACPLLTEVGVALGNAETIRSAYLGAEPLPAGETPTGESIQAAADALATIAGSAPKYILLVTDGDPDTCAQPNPQNGLDEAVAAALGAAARGIRVYTVGLDGIAELSLQAMANAGQGKDPALFYGIDADAVEPLHASTDPRVLADQLKGVIGDVRSCIVELREEVGPGRAFEGTLTLDGATLAYGSADGWTFIDADTLEIHGAACESILGQGERLEVRFPCVTELGPR